MKCFDSNFLKINLMCDFRYLLMLVRMETGVSTLKVSAPAPASALQSRFPKNPVFLFSDIQCH